MSVETKINWIFNIILSQNIEDRKLKISMIYELLDRIGRNISYKSLLNNCLCMYYTNKINKLFFSSSFSRCNSASTSLIFCDKRFLWRTRWSFKEMEHVASMLGHRKRILQSESACDWVQSYQSVLSVQSNWVHRYSRKR